MKFTSFTEFYPFYLSQHDNLTCRRLHFVGSILALFSVVATLYTHNFMWLILAPIGGYGFAWVGHFFYEKNKPATFKYPLYSFIGDWVMFWQILTRKIAI